MPDITGQLTTALADRYRIESHLGEGGMATVYLAHDMKHNRKVALKVLRPELAAMIGAERFLQEIEVTANLQHPHILPLHDSGDADGFLFYVMPYVEGESLRVKLNREKQLSIEDAVEIAKSVAAALDYAHRQGVIHRDIKPENILMHDGQALVADFGIALAVSQASGQRLTETGLSIGTPHYMSPEQAMGDRELDARSDVYSLGAMLYEMLAGDPPYQGSTAQAIVAKVITEKAPPVTTHRDTVPSHVAASVTKALSKLPADRFTSAAEFAEALTNTAFTLPKVATAPVGAPEAEGKPPWSRFAWPAVAAVLAGVALWGWLKPAPTTRTQAVRFVVAPGEDQRFDNTTGVDVAFSADGSRLVYRGQAESGTQLYGRAIDELEARPISGTEGASQPFFSPDGQWLGFYADGQLKKVPAAGGPPLPIAQTDLITGASWGPGDVIVFGRFNGGLMRVPGAGGTPEAITVPDTAAGEIDHRWPEILPGGEAVAFTSWLGGVTEAQIAVASLESGTVTRLSEVGTGPHYASTGHLVYTRSDGTAVAVPFDIGSLAVTGQAIPLLEGVAVAGGGAVELAVSGTGSLVFVPGAGVQGGVLVMVDRQGAETVLDDRALAFGYPRFSPSGDRVAVEIDDHIWLYDVEQRTLSVRTFEGTNVYPTWTPDGTRVVYASSKDGGQNLYSFPADGSSRAELFFESEYNVWESALSPDGKWLAFRESYPNTGRDILVAPLDGEDRTRAFAQTTFEERSLALSPDGSWLAYVSDQSGRDEIYVRAFPEPTGQTQVSIDGGSEPAWARDGSELFYRTGSEMMAAAVQTSPSFRVTGREGLFDDRHQGGNNHTAYDVDPRGGGFLMVKVESGTGSVPLVVVANWFAELKSRVGN